MEKELRFTRASRRHKIGRASVRYVLAHTDPDETVDPDGLRRYSWIGDDERGRELEIVAIDLPDCVLILHVMPTALRKRT